MNILKLYLLKQMLAARNLDYMAVLGIDMEPIIFSLLGLNQFQLAKAKNYVHLKYTCCLRRNVGTVTFTTLSTRGMVMVQQPADSEIMIVRGGSCQNLHSEPAETLQS